MAGDNLRTGGGAKSNCRFGKAEGTGGATGVGVFPLPKGDRPKELLVTSLAISLVLLPGFGRTGGKWAGGGEGEVSCDDERVEVRRGRTGGGGAFPGPLPPAFGALKASEAAATRPIALDISGFDAADVTALEVPDALPGPPPALAFAAALCLSPAVIRLAVASGLDASALCTADAA